MTKIRTLKTSFGQVKTALALGGVLASILGTRILANQEAAPPYRRANGYA